MACSQARSKRTLDKPIAVTSLADEALRQACTFVSCFKVGVPASSLSQDLETWWTDIGKKMLWGETGETVDIVEDEDDDDDGAEAEGPDQEECEKELQDLTHNIECAQKVALIEEELTSLKENPDTEEADYPQELLSDDEELDAEVADLRPKLDVFTLHDVLEQHDLLNFQADLSEYEGKTMKRIRPILQTMRRFVVLVRLNEGILKKPSVVGVKRECNHHNFLQHQLALARTAFQCFAQNQSRFAMWQGFQERVLLELQEKDPSATGSQAVQKLGGMTAADGKGRSYQLLVVRPFQAGEGSPGLRVGVPVAVWRYGRNKLHQGTPKLVPDGSIPMHLVSKVHVMLLNPFTDNTADPPVTYLIGSLLVLRFIIVFCFCNLFHSIPISVLSKVFLLYKACGPLLRKDSILRSLSPVVALDTKDGSILYEIPAKDFSWKETASYVPWITFQSETFQFKMMSGLFRSCFGFLRLSDTDSCCMLLIVVAWS